MQKRFWQSFEKNPGIWILGGLLVFSVYSHYQTGGKLTEMCVATTALTERYWLEAKFDGHDRLMQEDSDEGRDYRWIFYSIRKIEELCGERLAE